MTLVRGLLLSGFILSAAQIAAGQNLAGLLNAEGTTSTLVQDPRTGGYAGTPVCKTIPPVLAEGPWGDCPPAGGGGGGWQDCTVHAHEGSTGEVCRQPQDMSKIEAHIKCPLPNGNFNVYLDFIDCSTPGGSLELPTVPHGPGAPKPKDPNVQPPKCDNAKCCTGPLTGDQAQRDCVKDPSKCGQIFNTCGGGPARLSDADRKKFCDNLKTCLHPKCTIETKFDENGRPYSVTVCEAAKAH